MQEDAKEGGWTSSSLFLLEGGDSPLLPSSASSSSADGNERSHDGAPVRAQLATFDSPSLSSKAEPV